METSDFITLIEAAKRLKMAYPRFYAYVRNSKFCLEKGIEIHKLEIKGVRRKKETNRKQCFIKKSDFVVIFFELKTKAEKQLSKFN